MKVQSLKHRYNKKICPALLVNLIVSDLLRLLVIASSIMTSGNQQYQTES